MIGRRPTLSDSQPATSGIGTDSTISPAYIRFGRRLGQLEDVGHVQQREQVRHARARARRRRRPTRGRCARMVGGRPRRFARRRGRSPAGSPRGRSAPVSRTQRNIARATSAAGIPKTIEAPRQPTAARTGGPASAAMTVPTLPPEMWALIAKPRRSAGNCSASRPLPTGCWGEPPMRDTMLSMANDANEWRPPAPRSRRRRAGRRRASSERRATRRVTKA